MDEEFRMAEGVKSGYKTTEFWTTMSLNLGGIIGMIPMEPNSYVILNAVYAISRALSKMGVIRGTLGHVLENVNRD